MTGEARYESPAAARSAVTDKLKTATTDSPWTLGDLQRHYAYDRLVERLYRHPHWTQRLSWRARSSIRSWTALRPGHGIPIRATGCARPSPSLRGCSPTLAI